MRASPLFIFLSLIIFLGSISRRSFAADTITDPYPGIQHIHRSTSNKQMHLVKVDLTRSDIRLRATKPGDRGRTVGSMANLYDCEVAINGDYFSLPGYVAWGLAIGGGEVWPDAKYPYYMGFIAAGIDNRVQLSFPTGSTPVPESWMVEAVGGAPAVIQDGTPVSPDCTDIAHDCVGLHPRTGIGISQDGKTLYLVVIDGRTSIAIGAPTIEIGQFMSEFGAWNGLNFDGGGSSTMYIKAEGGVVNNPSDGSQRVVANHFCVDVVSPFGTLKGVVREGDTEGTSPGIGAVTVSLSTGESTTTNDDGAFEIANVPRGTVTVTATREGYLEASQEVYVPAQETASVTLALVPGVAPGDSADESSDMPIETTDSGVSVDMDEDVSGDGAPTGTYVLRGHCQLSSYEEVPWLFLIAVVAFLFLRRAR